MGNDDFAVIFVWHGHHWHDKCKLRINELNTKMYELLLSILRVCACVKDKLVEQKSLRFWLWVLFLFTRTSQIFISVEYELHTKLCKSIDDLAFPWITITTSSSALLILLPIFLQFFFSFRISYSPESLFLLLFFFFLFSFPFLFLIPLSLGRCLFLVFEFRCKLVQ